MEKRIKAILWLLVMKAEMWALYGVMWSIPMVMRFDFATVVLATMGVQIIAWLVWLFTGDMIE